MIYPTRFGRRRKRADNAPAARRNRKHPLLPLTDFKDYRIEQFTPSEREFSELGTLICDSFVDHGADQGGTIAFDKETFNLKFNSPIRDENVFIRAIHEETGDIVGFLGGVPRTTFIEGQPHRIGAPAWIAVRPQHQRKGLAKRMGLELLEAGIERGYKGGLATFEPEAHGIDTALSIARDKNLSVKQLVRIEKFMIRIFDVGRTSKAVKLKWYHRLGLRVLQGIRKVDNPRIREMYREESDQLYDLTLEFIEQNQVAFLREREEFKWFVQQPGVNCVVHEDSTGAPDGFMVAWKHLLGGHGKLVPAGWLSIVHSHHLEDEEARDLAGFLSQTSADRGWVGLQTPLVPYFDPSPFQKERYQMFDKDLLIYLFSTEDVQIPEEIQSVYYDFE